MKKENILYVSSDSGMGGASQSLCDMLDDLRGYINPTVVIPDSGELENRLKEMCCKYYVVPLSNGFGKIGQHTVEDEERDFAINYRAALKIKEIIEEEKIALVHINSSVCNAGAMGAILAKTPYVWHVRELVEEHYGCEFWDAGFKRMLFQKADVFIAISKCVQEAWVHKYDRKSQVLYDGIKSGHYVQDIREKKGDEHGFLIAGNITKEKGQLDAIEAIKILKEKGIKDVRLHIVGGCTGRFTWCLKKYSEKYDLKRNVVLHPFTKDLSELRRECAYAIVASKFEALGRVTAEAMMAGNIVIGADTGGTLELVGVDKRKGYIYKQGDSRMLALAMEEAMNADLEERRRMQEEAQNFALRAFDTKEYAREMHDVYKKVLSGEHPADKKLIQYLEEKYEYCRTSDTKFGNAATGKLQKIKEIEKELIKKSGALKEAFDSMHIRRVAIYGMGRLGYKVYDTLKELQFEIPFVIDQNPYFLDKIMDVFAPEDKIPEVDVIIITVVDDDDIKHKYMNVANVRKVFHISELMGGLQA